MHACSPAEQELHHSQSCDSAGGAVLNNSALSSPWGQMMQSRGTFASVQRSRGLSTGPVSAVRAPAQASRCPNDQRHTLPRAPTHTPVTHVSPDWHLPPSSGTQTYLNSAKLARADLNNSLFKAELVSLCSSVQVCVCVCRHLYFHNDIIVHSYIMCNS